MISRLFFGPVALFVHAEPRKSQGTLMVAGSEDVLDIVIAAVAVAFGAVVVIMRNRFAREVAASSTMFARDKELTFRRQERLAKFFVPLVGGLIAATGTLVILETLL